MSKIVKLSKWPFEQDERVKLIWIGEPFRQNRRWMVKAYFRSITKRETKYIVVDWPTISFKQDKKLYIILSIEIIRSILGIDSFTLKIMLNMDNLFEYLIYEVEQDVLSIYFSNQYNKKLLTSDRIYHLAWALTNSTVLFMFNHISSNYNMGGNKMLNFKFEMERFNIRARVKEKRNRIFIQEIVRLKNKEINVSQIYVEHPSIEKSQNTANPKKREYITYTDMTNKQVNIGDDVDGANKGIEVIKSRDVIHNYPILPEIIKSKMENRQKRSSVDENTKRYYYNDKGKRTLRKEGGENTERGLEFCKVDNISIEGELKKFVQIMKALQTKPQIYSIDILIDKLPISNGGRFAWLEDGVTVRKYAFCKITMRDDKERTVLEVERENKALSTFVMRSNSKKNWEKVCFKLLYGLVKNSGSWRKKDIQKTCNIGIGIIRKKHTNSTEDDMARQIYTILIG